MFTNMPAISHIKDNLCLNLILEKDCQTVCRTRHYDNILVHAYQSNPVLEQTSNINDFCFKYIYVHVCFPILDGSLFTTLPCPCPYLCSCVHVDMSIFMSMPCSCNFHVKNGHGRGRANGQ
jgi:hypothetical protein